MKCDNGMATDGDVVCRDCHPLLPPIETLFPIDQGLLTSDDSFQLNHFPDQDGNINANDVLTSSHCIMLANEDSISDTESITRQICELSF